MSNHRCTSSLVGLLLLVASSCSSASRPDFEGTWSLLSWHDKTSGETESSPDGMLMVDYDDGERRVYVKDSVHQACALRPYSARGNTLTFANGTKEVMQVNEPNLRITVTTDGKETGYADYLRLEGFTPQGYGTCGNPDDFDRAFAIR